MPPKKKPIPESRTGKVMIVAGVALPVHLSELLRQFLNILPERSGIAWLFMHHPAVGAEGFSKDVLRPETDIPVHEFDDQAILMPDNIYLVPADKWVVVKNNELALMPQDASEGSIAVDVFFKSLAEVYGAATMAIVLSGSATDRLMGLKAIKASGGVTFLESSMVPEVKRQTAEDVTASGAIDFILPVDALVHKVMDLRRAANPLLEEDNYIELNDEVYKQVLSILQARRGTDFTYYKQSTIRRRILRRMALHKQEMAEGYLALLDDNKTEQDALYQDLLIPVTSFFRDPRSFEDLCDNVFKMLVKNKSHEKPVRIWVAGCSTGEEAYSIAICLKEYLDERINLLKKDAVLIKAQVFATDISEPAISKARSGLYSKGELEGVSEDRLHKFFIQYNGGYQVKKPIRDMCVFANHDLITDPPFARIDLISCRNVLIYMEPYLQKKILATFHYALREDSFLMLGKSETTGSSSELFTTFDKQNKIYMKKDMPSRFMPIKKQRVEPTPADMDTTMKSESSRPDFQKTADDIILAKYAPAGVVINEQMDIVHFRGSTGVYLQPAPGKPSLNLLKMARPGLAFELRNILHKARSGREPAVKENIPVIVNDQQQLVTVEAITLANTIEPHYLILFHSVGSQPNGTERTGKSTKESPGKLKPDPRDQRIQQLEQELAHLRDDMRSVTEEMEASNEEMQSTNEELLSSSEELQSLNEELETTNAELQSANEELLLLNQQLVERNEQLNQARLYAEAIITTIREPLVILNRNLRLVGGNNAFYRTFGSSEKETTGKLFFEINNYQWNLPVLRASLEKALPENGRLDDIEFKHQFEGLGERTLVINAREIESDSTFEKLYLLAIQDITDSRYTKALIQSENRFRSLIEALPQIVWITSPGGRVEYVNDLWCEYTGIQANGLGHEKWDQRIHPADREDATRQWQQALKTGEPVTIEYRLRGADNSYKWFLFKSVPIHSADGKIVKWIGTSTNIDDQKNVEAIIKESEERLRLSVESTGIGFWDYFPETGKLIWSDRCRELFGLANGVPVNFDIFLEGLHPDDRAQVNSVLEGALNGTDQGSFELECRTVAFDTGQLRWIRAAGQAYFDLEKKATRFVGIMQDITNEKQIEQTLKDSEEYFRKMSDNTPVIMWVTDTDGSCTYFNKRWYDFTGQTEQEALGFGWLQAVHTDDLARTGDGFLQMSARRIPMNMEYRLRSKDGSYRWVLDSGLPRFDLLGNFVGYVGAMVDIDARKLAEQTLMESEKRFRNVADTAPVMIWTSGPNKACDFFNKGWLDFTGRRMEDELGFKWLDSVHPDDREKCEDSYNSSFDARRSFRMEYRLRRYDGEYRWVSNAGTPRFLTDGAFAGYAGASVEIHEQKLSRGELEKIIEKRTHDLKYANAELKLTNQNLEQFAYVASHDLQEPLRKIQTFVELLREKSKHLLTAETKTYMERIGTSADRMKTLISDLLTFSRLSDHEESFIASDLGKIVTDVLVDFDLLISQKNASIHTGKLPVIEAIPMQMHQLFYNLINNALKFSRPHVPPEISISSKELSGQELALYSNLNQQLRYYEIIVSDNGIGFSEQYADVIFTIFQRLHGRSQYEGTGIGLALCRKIMNNHQGEIFANGIENHGARFHVILPAKQA